MVFIYLIENLPDQKIAKARPYQERAFYTYINLRDQNNEDGKIKTLTFNFDGGVNFTLRDIDGFHNKKSCKFDRDNGKGYAYLFETEKDIKEFQTHVAAKKLVG